MVGSWEVFVGGGYPNHRLEKQRNRRVVDAGHVISAGVACDYRYFRMFAVSGGSNIGVISILDRTVTVSTWGGSDPSVNNFRADSISTILILNITMIFSCASSITVKFGGYGLRVN
jgi:hypothetical protein